MEVHDFYHKLKQHCESLDGDCQQCHFNDFCYTSPISMTDYKINRSLDLLEEAPKGEG